MFSTIDIKKVDKQMNIVYSSWKNPKNLRNICEVFGGFSMVFGVFQWFLGFFFILNLKIKKSRKNIK